MPRTIFMWLLATLVTYLAASASATMLKLQGFAKTGFPVLSEDVPGMFISDIQGLWQYGLVLLIALGVGFVVAHFAKKILTPLSAVAYIIAGGAAVAAALWLIRLAVGIMPIGESPIGFAYQVGAGALGGLFFQLTRKSR